ncbi:hypothetical protein [Roseateles puraquae]|uniref:Uncharacterized protein n=1 Tax=Roseateles puraquae TaxID=431059 RepID=A0A254NLG5_9BURK|nr:hypothetical protein [Roseateles puraquae]MDG0853567.1 hypothetical protein [Roseateles puraquae]OWR05738.1 hypothetical protein CDO81_04625 [Roseateles puraquae]
MSVVTAAGVGLTLERALNGDLGDTIGMLLATALVIVLPLAFGKPTAAPTATAAAREGGDDAR